MKHIDLDGQDARIKEFFLALEVEPEGSILEIQGRPLVQVLPVAVETGVEETKLVEAIRNRRDESLALHAEWSDVDRETWPPNRSGSE